MDVTVAICTWNRAQSLDATLAHLCKLRVPPQTKWELVVINNRSTDNTEEVIGRYNSLLPLRAVVEHQQGISHSRNRVLAEAKGDLLLCIDDDVLVDPDWLQAYQRAAADWPEAAYFGGNIEPLFESSPPAWILKNPQLVEAPFAVRQLGHNTRPLDSSEMPFGANMAFRRRFLAGLSFDSTLGRVGAGFISGDEIDLIRRLLQQGAKGVWVGSARVKHIIPKERLTTGYIWNFFSGLAVAELRLNGMPPGKRWFNMPRWMIKLYLESRIKSLIYTARKGSRWARAFRESAWTFGALRELVKTRNC
jgi:glycosyltransferase involved in cell wall biosynthesis